MSLAAALADWRSVVGDDWVEDRSEVLEHASRATYATTQRAAAIVRPGTTGMVQECVRIAHRNGIGLWPLSTGKNWGYGSRVPAAEGAVMLDLGRLVEIIDFDPEMGYVTVEPGVTQRRLHEFLAERGGTHWMDATGSTPDASLIGNIMERGFGITPYGDHVGRSCGYEIVLADGSLLRTGFGAWPKARTASLDRWAPGPSLEGLFSQTGLGVVTKLSIAVMPVPETACTAFVDIDNDEALVATIDIFRRAQLEGTVRSAPWFGNVYRLLGTVMRFPWSVADPPLLPGQARQIGRLAGIAPWTGVAGLYGTSGQVEAARERLAHLLTPAGVTPRFEDHATLAVAPAGARRSVALAMHRGYTGGLLNAVRRAYWRKRVSPNEVSDLDEDGVGFIFANASVPFRGADIVEASRIAEEVVISYGFEPAISCHSIRERVLTLLMTVAYDRDVEGEDERAQVMHNELAERWLDHGWCPFRLGLHSAHLFERVDPSYRRTVAAITDALDPTGVIAPGRYRSATKPAPARGNAPSPGGPPQARGAGGSA